MTSFKITNDDLGVRGLQKTNKTPVISGPVQPVKASNPVQKSPENLPLTSGKTKRRNTEDQSSQRRHVDRRKTDSSVLLNTRSEHDRRTKTGKSSDADNDVISTSRGINETT